MEANYAFTPGAGDKEGKATYVDDDVEGACDICYSCIGAVFSKLSMHGSTTRTLKHKRLPDNKADWYLVLTDRYEDRFHGV